MRKLDDCFEFKTDFEGQSISLVRNQTTFVDTRLRKWLLTDFVDVRGVSDFKVVLRRVSDGNEGRVEQKKMLIRKVDNKAWVRVDDVKAIRNVDFGFIEKLQAKLVRLSGKIEPIAKKLVTYYKIETEVTEEVIKNDCR